MTRLIKTLALSFACLVPTTAASAEEDTQLWLDATASYPLSDDTRVSFQVNPRLSLDCGRTDVLQLRSGIDHRLSNDIGIGGGLILLGEFGPTEKRPYVTVNLGSGPVTFRTMPEFRFFRGADRMELRFRQRMQLALPIVERTKFVTSGELFYTAQNRIRGGDTRITQWRAIASVSYAASDELSLSAGYLALGTPRPDAEDSLSHIATLGLTYSF